MLIETGNTLRRQWTMLRAIPRWPQSIGINGILGHLLDEGYTITRRTIERDLQELSRYLPLFVDDRRRPAQWCWAKEANFEFSPRLSASQSLALLLVQKNAASMLPRSMLEDLAPVFAAAERELAQTGWKHWPDRIAVLPPNLVLLPPKLHLNVLDDVHTTLVRRRVLLANYRKKGALAAESMRIHPLGLLLRGPVQYLVCTIEGRERVRTLVLSRLSATAVDASPCEEPPGFDFDAFIDTLAIVPKGEIHLRLRYYEHAGEHVRETPLANRQKNTVIGDGIEEVSAIVQWDDQLEWWLLQYGSRVEVLKPVALRRKMAEEHLRAAARYAS